MVNSGPLSLPAVIYRDGAQFRFHQRLHFPRRKIRNYRFLHTETGKGKLSVAGGDVPLEDRTVLLLSPGYREGYFEGSKSTSYVYIEFQCDEKLTSRPWLRCDDTSQHFQTVVNLLRSILHEETHAPDSPTCSPALILSAVQLMTLSADRCEAPKSMDERVVRVIEYVKENISRPLTVSELANRVHLSEPHFRRLFRKAMGIGPKQYLLQCRMGFARQILESDGLRVGAVARLLGFESVYQFSNQYRKVHGQAPSSHRVRTV